MKTTIEIPDTLFNQARRYAKKHHITMKTLIEQGLRNVMAEKTEEAPFELRDGSFHGGSGLAPEFQNANWEQIRDAIYEGRGA